MAPRYFDLTLEIESSSESDCRVKIRAPGVVEVASTHFPLTGLESEFLHDILKTFPPSASQRIEQFGCKFFQSIIRDEVYAAFSRCVEKARHEEKQIRIRLDVQAPKFAALPLEYCFHPGWRSFLCTEPDICLVRSPAQTLTIQPLKVKPPLRVLVMSATPLDQKPLAAEREKELIKEELGHLEAQGLVSITWVSRWEELQNELEEHGPYHVFHLICHGSFNTITEEGAIALADADNKTRLVGAKQLANLLRAQYRSLRLAVLNFCQGAASGVYNIFSSTASLLARQGVKAVLAVQTEISNRAALLLTRTFYHELAKGVPVDIAVTKARRFLLQAESPSLEWGAVVLHLSSPDAILFEVTTTRSGLSSRPTPRASDMADKLEDSTRRSVDGLADASVHTTDIQRMLDEGHSHEEAQRLEEALAAYEQALQLDPACATALARREALQKETALRKAFDDCEAKLAIHNDSVLLMERLQLLNELHRYKEALRRCDELIHWLGIDASFDDLQIIYTCRGDALLGLGDLEAATQAYKKAQSYER